MANVTYLLGAGASANALPVINGISGRLGVFASLLDRDVVRSADWGGKSNPAELLLKSLREVQKRTEKHLTVDTLARKLFAQVRYHDELEELKRILICYFVFEQLPLHMSLNSKTKQTPDQRYDNLIATLISDEIDNLTLSPNVKVLTWNYDVQFELAYKEFCDLETIWGTHERLQVLPGKWLSKRSTVNVDEFSLIHLNGVIGYENILNNGGKTQTVIDKHFNEPGDDFTMLEDLVKLYDRLRDHTQYTSDRPEAISFLNFSWESKQDGHDFRNPFTQANIDNSLLIAERTEVLVVIGYSFPAFNRWLDKRIINSMKNLRKVYIQDLNPENVQSVMTNAFEAFQPPFHKQHPEIPFALTDSIDQFVIPYEV